MTGPHDNAPHDTALQTRRCNGVDQVFRLEGPADAPVVMLTHGLLADHSMWDAMSGLLTQRYRVLRPDLRGHGRSGTPPLPWTMQDLANDAVALLDALGLGQVHFIGSSLGGMIGQQLGALQGGRFRSLTLANTGAVQLAPAAWDERIAVARSRGTEALADGTLQRWFTPAFAAAQPDTFSQVRRVLCTTSAEGFAGCAAVVRDLDQLHLLPRISAPVLVVAGALDQATPPSLAQQLHEGIAGSRLVTLQAAHQSAIEQPAAFLEAWHSFVAGLA